MNSASLTYGAGPGSTITLTAETIRVRDAIIAKFSDKSLAELNSFIETALSAEKNDNKRLGILAARVYILRMRMQNISSFNRDPSQKAISELTPADMLKAPQTEGANAEKEGEGEIAEDMYEEWNELMVVESGEINGVRIPKGVTITVGIEDARRLIETKKAVFAKSLSDDTAEVSPPIPEQSISAAEMEMPSLEEGENPDTPDNDVISSEAVGVETTSEAAADNSGNLGEPVLASNSDIEQAMAELAEGEELDLTAPPQSDKDNH